MIHKLDENILKEAVHWLAERDTALARVFRQYGYPPLWARTPGFSTLVHIILEQQVSLASANAAFQKLQERLEQVSPEALLTLDDATLRNIGFSRQKITYTRQLATAVSGGQLDLARLHYLPDEEVREELKRMNGIGDWTADIYLSECLLRPDILPKGDIAMQESFRILYNLPSRPAHEEFVEKTRHWQPWRSAATRMLWHFYLCERNRQVP